MGYDGVVRGFAYVFIIIVLVLYPIQWCKSNIHVGNAEQCMLAFILLHIVHCVFIYVPCSTV